MKLAKAIKKAKRVYICGNGGSAANAIHMANDLVACGIRAHSLTGEIASVTASANDIAARLGANSTQNSNSQQEVLMSWRRRPYLPSVTDVTFPNIGGLSAMPRDRCGRTLLVCK